MSTYWFTLWYNSRENSQLGFWGYSVEVNWGVSLTYVIGLTRFGVVTQKSGLQFANKILRFWVKSNPTKKTRKKKNTRERIKLPLK